MIKMKKLIAVAMASLMAMSLVACSSDDTTSQQSNTNSNTQTTTQDNVDVDTDVDTDADVDADDVSTETIDAIKEKGTLTMMTSTGFPPFEYIGDDGKPAGVDIDIAQIIADKLEVELEVIDMDFGLLVDALKTGKGDIVAAGMTATEERALSIDFSDCYNLNGLILLIPADSDIKTAEDLVGKTVAVQESTTADIYVQEDLGQTSLAFKTVIEAASAVATGKADAVLADKLPAYSLASAYEGLVVIDDYITVEEMSLGLPKGSDDLLALVNEILAEMIAEDEINTLIDYHYAICEEG